MTKKVMFLFERSTADRKSVLAAPVVAMSLAVCALVLCVSACGSAGEPGGTPDLTGLTLSEAQTLASEAGLELIEGETLPSFLPADTILAQDPLPGTDSDDIGAIEVIVSRDPVPVQIRAIKPKDPDADGHENDDLLPNLYDGDLSTYWSTETTYRSPDFQGLGDKIGVGFSFWLEEGATMLKIDYTLTGWKGEVQMVSTQDLPIALAQLGQNKRVSWLQPITSGRIWFTQLAPLPDSDRYGAIINEITFYR